MKTAPYEPPRWEELPRCSYRGPDPAAPGVARCLHPEQMFGPRPSFGVCLNCPRSCATPDAGAPLALSAAGRPVQPEAPKDGPGTELKRLLARLFLRDRGDCGCAAMVAAMNRWGPEGCRANLGLILEHLRRQAGKRNLPFYEPAARLLVLRAIRRVERLQRRAPT